MKEIAIVPARKGSKRLKNKNALKINGKSLFEITLNLVNQRFHHIWFNSDSDDYLNKVKNDKVICYKRKDNLGSDKTSTEEVILDWINDNKFDDDDLIYLFQPTTVFRNLKFLDAFIDEARTLKKCASLISVSKLKKVCKINNNHLESMSYNFGDRSQDVVNSSFVKENGLGYAFHVRTIKQFGLFGELTIPFFSDEFCLDVDIDTKNDFLITKEIIENGI